MAKLIVLSIVLLSFIVPIRLSVRPRSGKSALRRAQMILVICAVVWALMCILWYPQLVPVD